MRLIALLASTAAIFSAPAAADTPFADFMNCVRENGQSHISAHRAGPAPGAAENSLLAIRRSHELGAAVAEIDVARTADGVLILMHDRTLDRTTTGSGNVVETDFADMAALRLVDNDGAETEEGVPTLADAFALADELGIYLQLDMKSASALDVIEAARAAGKIDEVGLIAYTPEATLTAHRAAPTLYLSAPDRPEVLGSPEIDLSYISVWLGVGMPDAQRDGEIGYRGMETGAGLFRLEDGSANPYLQAAETGVELLAADNVQAASGALGGAETLQAQIAKCRTRS
jgi:glycerophosphoryl diester phosphodiesterase